MAISGNQLKIDHLLLLPAITSIAISTQPACITDAV
jgi:hypothetical protein